MDRGAQSDRLGNYTTTTRLRYAVQQVRYIKCIFEFQMLSTQMGLFDVTLSSAEGDLCYLDFPTFKRESHLQFPAEAVIFFLFRKCVHHSHTHTKLLLLLLLLLNHFSRVQLCAIPQTAAHQAPLSWDSPGENTGVGCHFLLHTQSDLSNKLSQGE